MGSIGLPEIIILLIIVILIFGGKKLPELGKGLGQAIRSFNKGVKGDDQIEKSSSETESDSEKKS